MKYDPDTYQPISSVQPKPDCVSRQAAIDLFPDDDLEYDTKGGYVAPHLARRMICELPFARPEPHWIPCSERLPEEKERSYWVCLETGGQCQCRWTNDMYGLGANKWSKWGWHIMDKPQYSKIVAWMPLPEPYRGGDSE